MQSIEIRGLDELDKRLDALLKEAPEAKRRLNEELSGSGHGIRAPSRRNVIANAIYIAEKFTDDLAKKIMG